MPVLRTNHLTSITDLSYDEIISLFELTSRLKSCVKKNKKHAYLPGKTLAMIFEKSSTRTRVSFETGIFQLGGQGLFLDMNSLQLGRGETISDTARVFSRYVDAIMIRTFSHQRVIELANNSNIPVINGLSDTFHPCQALTDFFTIYERNKTLKGTKLLYIGDGNNVANSLLLGAAILGIDITIACPKSYEPDKDIIEKASIITLNSGAKINITSSIDEAAENANYIYTDVWISMGQEKEAAKKKKLFKKYKISKEILNKCAKDCLVMHCLPAHRGEEIDAEIMDSGRSIIFDQAENRLHIQKAVMCSLMKNK
ncbi:MAG: ornithine carbamoyltransferase [Spirochaetes bacterium]|nr:ornithine carbamoyltransferase [Spirochaetota bacterium]